MMTPLEILMELQILMEITTTNLDGPNPDGNSSANPDGHEDADPDPEYQGVINTYGSKEDEVQDQQNITAV